MVSNTEIMNRNTTIIREKFDYTKWQQQRFDNMSSDEFQKAAIAYSRENPFFTKE